MKNKVVCECLQGISSTAYAVFGSHFTREYQQDGVRFTVYAPNARDVKLIGDFNSWIGYEMFDDGGGVWSIFAANIPENAQYKYRITTANGEVHDRIDPFAFYSEVRPNTASVVYSIDGFRWGDKQWMGERTKNYNAPVNIYEMHIGSWKRKPNDTFLSYTDLIVELIPYIKQMGYTHVELLPLTEHPLDASWGYQPTGYYSATSRYGEPRQLMQFVNACHKEHIGVLMDFVPLHFVTDFYALHQFDGGFLYESEFENLRFSPWQTALFDFTKPYVLSFMKSALDFWLTYYHIDGVRFDAVSNLIYNHGIPDDGMNEAGVWMMKNVNYTLQNKFPSVMLMAEDSSNYLKVTAPVEYGGLGFDYKWDLGWMHDTLDFLALPVHERHRAYHKLTFSMKYFYNEKYILPFSHDEVVHGKKTIIDKLYGSYEEKFSQAKTLYLYMLTHPGKKLNFMGNELAEFKEWDETKGLEFGLTAYPTHEQLNSFIKQLNVVYCENSPLYIHDYNSAAFEWIDGNNSSQCIYTYKRKDLEGNSVYTILNFSGNFYPKYNFRVDSVGDYIEIISTDWAQFGGGGVENKIIHANFGAQTTINVAVPPFAGIMIKLMK